MPKHKESGTMSKYATHPAEPEAAFGLGNCMRQGKAHSTKCSGRGFLGSAMHQGKKGDGDFTKFGFAHIKSRMRQGG